MSADCLRSFTELEELDETELYMCHKCKKRQKSTKKFWVQKLPKVSLLSLALVAQRHILLPIDFLLTLSFSK